MCDSASERELADLSPFQLCVDSPLMKNGTFGRRFSYFIFIAKHAEFWDGRTLLAVRSAVAQERQPFGLAAIRW